mmetsp:Transcript_33910/g.93065  ORF Transcript_33910/g.93065 Transcript_33910/m.93065 type:complete len:304 (-) Transcript_33910:914-1825(-)
MLSSSGCGRRRHPHQVARRVCCRWVRRRSLVEGGHLGLDRVGLEVLALLLPRLDRAVDLAPAANVNEAHLLEVVVRQVAQDDKIDLLLAKGGRVLLEVVGLQPHLDRRHLVVDVHLVHLSRDLAVLRLATLHHLHRSPQVRLIDDAQRLDVGLRLEQDEVHLLLVAVLDEDGRVLVQVPQLELVEDLLPPQQARVELLARPVGAKLFDRRLEIGLRVRDQLVAVRVGVEARVHLVARPLQQVVGQAAVVARAHLLGGVLLNDALDGGLRLAVHHVAVLLHLDTDDRHELGHRVVVEVEAVLDT